MIEKISETMPPTTNSSQHPYEISLRFYRAMQAKAVTLELDALRDELASHEMDHPAQLRRQRLLVQAQRDEAERLRDFLTRTTVRPEAQPAKD